MSGSKMVALVSLAATALPSAAALSFRTSRGPITADEAITGKAAAALQDAHCGTHTLCGSCLLEPDCVWCADGQGSCVPGNSDSGPAEDEISIVLI